MSSFKFEEDDTVAFINRSNGLRIGLINEVYSDHSDDSDDDDDSDDKSLKPNQVRVEWYPTGKETIASADNVKLIDRTLLMGEIVRPIGDLKKIGFIAHASVNCDVMFLPFGQYVLKSVDDSRVDFIQKFGDANSEPKYVMYENWVGSVSNVAQSITLKSHRGYRCVVSTSDDNCDLVDASITRVENSTFDDRQWYEGQTVKCSFGSLRKVRWLTESKNPPECFSRRITGECNHKTKFTIEKVDLESLTVHWISPIVGVEGKVDVPSEVVGGEDLKKIKLVNRFEHQFIQIGDRIQGEILPTDVIVPFVEWRRMLRDEIVGCGKDKVAAGSKIEVVQTDTKDIVAQSSECVQRSQKSADGEVADVQTPTPTIDDGDMWSDCESESSERTEKENATYKLSRRTSVSRSTTTTTTTNGAVSLKWLKKLKPPFKIDRPTSKKRRTSSSSDPHKFKTNPKGDIENRFRPGQKFFAEAVFIRSTVDVIWQDGTKSERMPTSQLAYAEVELDEHLFFPGSFVLLQEEKERLRPTDGYGIVESVDVANRLATVTWYEASKTDTGFVVPRSTKTECVSVYELIVHPDFQYPSGCLVMRIENLRVINDVYIGQVLYTTKEGLVHVQWLSGKYENVYPQELCKLVNDEAAWSEASDNLTDDEESATDADSDDSWSTVDDSNESFSENEDEDDDRAAGKKKVTLENILQRLKTLPTKIRDDVIELRKTNDNDVPHRKKVAKSVLRLYGVLKKIHGKYYGKPPMDNQHPEDLKNCITRLQQWLNALAAKSANDRRRNKERSSDSLSDDSTTYLDDELDKASKVEGKLRDHLEKAPSGGRHSGSKMKSDGRFGETFQLFSRLCAQLLSRLLGTRLATRPSRLEDSLQIERLIETMRENKPLFEQFFSSQVDTHSEDTEYAVGGSSNAAVCLSSSNSGETVAVSGDTAFLERLIDAQRAVDGLESPGLMDLMEFMRSSMSSMMKNKAQLDRFEEAPDSEAVLALIDVTIVSALMIFQLIVINFFNANKTNNADACVDDDKSRGEIAAVVDPEDDDGGEPPTDVFDESPSSASITPTTEVVRSSNESNFEIVEDPPSSHMYYRETFDYNSASSKFLKAVRHEFKILQNSLTADIFVKTYERRMDLFSVMIRGAPGTPYCNGLFLFDMRLKPSYPHDPPTVYYRAYASEQLNPNLYQDGKVCISLLGTWSGKDSEVWNPGSNLLQVLMSIQGLILNAEPYFNEAGYESRRSLVESIEKSRCYNEMALIRSLENLVNIATNPPSPFEKEILEHIRVRGKGLIEQIQLWITNAATCNFPLQPISLGCTLSAKKQLTKLEQLIAQKFT